MRDQNEILGFIMVATASVETVFFGHITRKYFHELLSVCVCFQMNLELNEIVLK